jgi:hypothetical protein
MTTKPLMLLDVDGVLNAFDGTRNIPAGYQKTVCNGYTIKWRPEVAARLRDLHDSEAVEIRWLTTWADEANAWISPALDLPILTVAGQVPFREKNGWWKLVVVRDLAVAEPTTPIVWVDDDIKGDRDAMAWLRTPAADNVLAICPAVNVGLTDVDLDLIEGWVAGKTAA